MKDLIDMMYDKKLGPDVIDKIRSFLGIGKIQFYSCENCGEIECSLHYSRKCCLCDNNKMGNNMYLFKTRNKFMKCYNKTNHYCPSCKDIVSYKITTRTIDCKIKKFIKKIKMNNKKITNKYVRKIYIDNNLLINQRVYNNLTYHPKCKKLVSY